MSLTQKSCGGMCVCFMYKCVCVVFEFRPYIYIYGTHATILQYMCGDNLSLMDLLLRCGGGFYILYNLHTRYTHTTHTRNSFCSHPNIFNVRWTLAAIKQIKFLWFLYNIYMVYLNITVKKNCVVCANILFWWHIIFGSPHHRTTCCK